MANIYQGTLGLIGNTPLVEVANLEKAYQLEAKVLAKLEYFNPAGSVKDRIAKAMIEDAEEKGILKEGSVIIEPTSGNTGIGLAAIAASKGYRIILTMPETMSVERRNILKAYGAEIELTDGTKGMKARSQKRRSLRKKFRTALFRGSLRIRRTLRSTERPPDRKSGMIPTEKWISLWQELEPAEPLREPENI